jgi:hypothetical protein
LDQDDPRYEAAYEEGPFSFEDEFEEWRRPPELGSPSAVAPRNESDESRERPKDQDGGVVPGASRPYPTASSITSNWDAELHESYDYDREALAAKGVVNVANTFSRFGLDKDDKERWPPLAQAVEELYRSMVASPAPQIADDQRLLGDWELIAATGDALAKRGGLTGLGKAPFTEPAGLYVTFRPDGLCVTKEVLQVSPPLLGQTNLLNELRGEFAFSDNELTAMQEKYAVGDLAGQPDCRIDSFNSTLSDCRITVDGLLRIGRQLDGILVYRRLEEGYLEQYLTKLGLPTQGGSSLAGGPISRPPA